MSPVPELEWDKDFSALLQENAADYSALREMSALKPDGGPVVQIVDQILAQAVRNAGSDIHFEPCALGMRVRFRLDGELNEVLKLPEALKPALVSRLKIMAQMDIAEKRLPQDGRFQLTLEGRSVDFRAATLPTVGGEKVMVRILARPAELMGLQSLGFAPEAETEIRALVHRPHGMILVVGPTGSGKTTTLYALLRELDAQKSNIVTLEDPVEYSLENINQVAVNPKIGLTFAGGLRALLRQDPDVIMAGEIRDRDTAELAVQAALTGHLVFSTLHTNSGVSTLTRLYDMGVERFLAANSLIGVISQRLVRKLCPACRQPFALSRELADSLGMAGEAEQTFYQPGGCAQCRHTGYRGRTVIYEFLPLDSAVRRRWLDGENDESRLEEIFRARGRESLRDNGLRQARSGITSLEEIERAVWLERD
jgi:type IV pilus assembly protein PilB